MNNCNNYKLQGNFQGLTILIGSGYFWTWKISIFSSNCTTISCWKLSDQIINFLHLSDQGLLDIFLIDIYSSLNFVIIVKTKVLLHQAEVTLAGFGCPVCALWFSCSQRLLDYLAFTYFERTWWRLFKERVVRTKFDISVFIALYKKNIAPTEQLSYTRRDTGYYVLRNSTLPNTFCFPLEQ